MQIHILGFHNASGIEPKPNDNNGALKEFSIMLKPFHWSLLIYANKVTSLPNDMTEIRLAKLKLVLCAPWHLLQNILNK